MHKVARMIAVAPNEEPRRLWSELLEECSAVTIRMAMMNIEFTGPIWYWRGPAPHHFVTVPEELCLQLKAISGAVTYGWGMIPVQARIGKTAWKTSLFPKNGGYIAPIRLSVQTAENLHIDDHVTVYLTVG